ncbi:MAG TPA: hypothetical protein VH589_12000 [Trebonia sp.]
MATEYGGSYGGQPWQRPAPPYRGQPPGGRGSGTVRRWVAVAALLLGFVGLVVSLAGVVLQLLPRQFTVQQQRQITDWELGRFWRELPAGRIFPASVTYPVPGALDDDPALRLTASRIGIARQGSCAAGTDAAVGAVLTRDGCGAMLRATYADGTDSYVITVGVAAMPGSAAASAAARELGKSGSATVTGVRALSMKDTPASAFTDGRRQLSGRVLAGPYLVFYTVGYAGSRPHLPVADDRYAETEMTAAGKGVAQKVGSVLDPPVPPPRCPGVPGC